MVGKLQVAPNCSPFNREYLLGWDSLFYRSLRSPQRIVMAPPSSMEPAFQTHQLYAFWSLDFRSVGEIRT